MVRASLTKPYAVRVLLEHALTGAEYSHWHTDILGGGGDPCQRSSSSLFSKTDGNPLFIEELTRSLARKRLPWCRHPTGYILTRPATRALDVPTTVQGVLLARIDRLPERFESRSCRSAAVVGRAFQLCAAGLRCSRIVATP